MMSLRNGDFAQEGGKKMTPYWQELRAHDRPPRLPPWQDDLI